MNESESLERPRANPRMRAALWIGGALVALAVVFCAGVVVGARNSPRVAAPAPPIPGPPPVGSFGQRGMSGAIMAIDGNILTLSDWRGGGTMRVNLGANTMIERGRQHRINAGELRVGDRVFIVGAPSSSGMFDAHFIGVTYPPPFNMIVPRGLGGSG